MECLFILSFKSSNIEYLNVFLLYSLVRSRFFIYSTYLFIIVLSFHKIYNDVYYYAL